MAGLVWGAVPHAGAGRRSPIVLLAAVGRHGTPLLRTADWVASGPDLAEWYLRPMGEHTTFTGFPWWGFVFAGGAAGIADRPGHASSSTSRRVLGAASPWLARCLAGRTRLLHGLAADASTRSRRSGPARRRISPFAWAWRPPAGLALLSPRRRSAARLGARAAARWRASDRALCSSTGFTSSSSTVRWRAACVTGCRSGRSRSAYVAFSAAMYAAVVLARPASGCRGITFAQVGRMTQEYLKNRV